MRFGTKKFARSQCLGQVAINFSRLMKNESLQAGVDMLKKSLEVADEVREKLKEVNTTANCLQEEIEKFQNNNVDLKVCEG